DAAVLGLDVAHPRSKPLLELAPPLRVAGLGEPARDARVDDEQGDLRRERDRLVPEGAGVYQDRVPGPAEDAGGLVEDPAGDADRAQLGPLAGERQLER